MIKGMIKDGEIMESVKCSICEREIQAEDDAAIGTCEPCRRKQEKEARLEEYNKTYEVQLQLQRYIKSLEKDIGDIEESLKTATRGARRLRKLIKINERDIKLYKKQLSVLPPLPPFK